jgi:membrane protease subunit (stomatin/prohibitin family)
MNSLVALTTIPLDSKVRDRLRSYGTAGMSYTDIVQRLLDERERDDFIREMQRLADEADATGSWVRLEDL